MNLLYDALPDTVTVDGKAYRIYTDYRDWLRFLICRRMMVFPNGKSCC